MASLNVQNAVVWGATAQQFFNLFTDYYTDKLGTVTNVYNSFATVYPWIATETPEGTTGLYTFSETQPPGNAQAIEYLFPAINTGSNADFSLTRSDDGSAGAIFESYLEPFSNTSAIIITPNTAQANLNNSVLTSSGYVLVAGSQQEFTFIPGAVETQTLSYQTGTTITNSVTNGISNTSTTGETVTETTGVTATGSIPGASTSVNESVAQAWSVQESQTINYSTSQTDAVNTNVTSGETVDINSAVQTGDDTWVYTNTETDQSFTLIPGNTYISSISVYTDYYSTSVPNTFALTGGNMTLDMYISAYGGTWNEPLTQNVMQLIQSGNWLGYSQYSGVDSSLFTYQSSPVAQANYTGLITSSSATGTLVSVSITPVTTTSTATTSGSSSTASQSASSLAPMMNINSPEATTKLDLEMAANKLSSSYGIYYNNTNSENEIKTKNVDIKGYDHAIVNVGNLNYTFTNFSDSTIKTGSGNNKFLFTEDDNNNYINLGSGNNQVDINGEGNNVFLGDGADWVNVTGGTGKNFVIAGDGPTILSFNNSNGFTQVSNWNTAEDAILFSPELARNGLSVIFDSTKWAYDVYINDDHVANIITTGGLKFADQNSNVYSQFYAAPMPYNLQSNEGFVNGLYVDAFERSADSAGLSYWAGQLDDGVSRKAVIQDFLVSDEYNVTHLNNSQYVNGLYQDILGRQEDTSGAAYWVSQLDSGVSRATVVGAFLATAEFNNLVGTYS